MREPCSHEHTLSGVAMGLEQTCIAASPCWQVLAVPCSKVAPEALSPACAAQVHLRHGSIASLALEDGVWHIAGSSGGAATADRVFLATGSHPRDDQLYPGPDVLPLDDALILSKPKGEPGSRRWVSTVAAWTCWQLGGIAINHQLCLSHNLAWQYQACIQQQHATPLS